MAKGVCNDPGMLKEGNGAVDLPIRFDGQKIYGSRQKKCCYSKSHLIKGGTFDSQHEKTFSERAKPEQSGDAKPRVLKQKDSRVAEEMSQLSFLGTRNYTDYKERSHPRKMIALLFLFPFSMRGVHRVDPEPESSHEKAKPE